MHMKAMLLTGAAACVLSTGGAEAAVKHRHHKPAAPDAAAAATNQRLDALAAEVESLKARLDQETLAREQSDAQVKAAQDQAATASADAQSARTQLAEQVQTVPGEIKAAVDAAKPKTDKIHYKGVTLTLGGFLEAADIYRSRDETADISSSFAKLPFESDRASHTAENAFSPRQTRVSALVEGDISPDVRASFYGEFDFQGAAQTANSNQSNSYNPRIRHLFGALDWDDSGWHLMAGQNFSLATLNSHSLLPRTELTPPQIDGAYLVGFVWTRQPQIRLVKDFGKTLWLGVSLENPQTTFSLNGTNSGVATGVTLTDSQAPTNGYYSGANYSLNSVPDVVAKIAYDPSFGDRHLHVEAFGLMRDFTDRVTIAPTAGTEAATLGYAAGTHTNNSYGGGVGAGLDFNALPGLLDVQASMLAGQGIGRYASGQLTDVTAKPDGQLVGIPETAWLVGGILHPTPQLDLYLFGGREAQQAKVYRYGNLPASVAFGYGTLPGTNNSGCLVEGGTCSALTKSVSEITAGFWDRFYQGAYGRLQVGVQYSHAERDAFADSTAAGVAPKASDDMVFTSFRYYPF